MDFKKKLLIFVLIIVILEIILRLMVRPSEHCFGNFFKLELGPCNMKYFDLSYPKKMKEIFENADKTKLAQEKRLIKKVIDGKNPGSLDLMGIMDEDTVTSYSPRKNSISPLGWWESNNIGSRNRYDVENKVTSGNKRILVFGESFTQCRGVIQEDTWPALLEKSLKNTEVLNFGVIGYGMSQSYLRYKSVVSKIDYDIVLFAFLRMDFVREINISPCFRKWVGCRPRPRFVLSNDKLELTQNPYPDLYSYHKDNDLEFSPKYLQYLRKYDAYYFPQKFEKRSFLSNFILFKVVSAIALDQKINFLNNRLSKKDSEAFQITRKIFENVNLEVKQNHKKFILVILPTVEDVNLYKSNQKFKKDWNNMIDELTINNIERLDLMPSFVKLLDYEYDTSYDNTHYGPKINKIIALEIQRYLKDN